jgi:dihydrodipicolinate synthase/N-acetylneuraminate lyase
MKLPWKGVIPAITTPFDTELRVDHAFLAEHARWLVDAGCTGLVPLGSLGEGATLDRAEKRAVVESLVRAVGSRVPIIPGISSLSTADAVSLARELRTAGARGLMVLPPYVYSTDWREMRAHVAAILAATDLPCLLYNNPVAYKTDFAPEHVAELAAEFPNLEAVKESSADVRRVAAIRALLGERLEVLVGVDDMIVEGTSAGAVGWIAGLVNALPKESVALFAHAAAGRRREATELYRWFLPLLRMDTVPKFVQLIKLAQERVGMGTSRVRPPRLTLEGPELEGALQVIESALVNRPVLPD